MRIFFSGTDIENLEDRASISNYFLMLIVGFTGNWVAKVAFKAKRKESGKSIFSLCNNLDKYSDIKIENSGEKEVLVVMDCKVVVEDNVPDSFKERLKKVKEEKEKEKEERAKFSSSAFGGPAPKHVKTKDDYYFGLTDKYPEFPFGEEGFDKPVKQRKISEMTDKEFSGFEGNQVKAYTLKHAKCLLNSILDGTYQPYDFSDCINKIKNLEKKLKNKASVLTYIDDFSVALQEHFDVCFSGTIFQYLELMEQVEDYLAPYAFESKLIQGMLNTVKDEIDVMF